MAQPSPGWTSGVAIVDWPGRAGGGPGTAVGSIWASAGSAVGIVGGGGGGAGAPRSTPLWVARGGLTTARVGAAPSPGEKVSAPMALDPLVRVRTDQRPMTGGDAFWPVSNGSSAS